MYFSPNISAISFTASTLLSGIIAWRAFLAWEKQKKNKMSKLFFKALVFISLYLGVRGVVSFFFVDSPPILSSVYLLSHIFLGIASSYLAKLAVLTAKPKFADLGFYAALGLFASDVTFNIIFPNQPYFNAQLNIIEWGTNKYVGIYHTLLCLLVFFGVFAVFTAQAIKNWQDKFIRTRCLLIAGGVLTAVLVTVPRNIFKAPVFLLISDISFSLSLGIVLWGISFGREEKER